MTTYMSLTRLRRPLAHVGQPTQLMPVVPPADPTPASDAGDGDGVKPTGRYRGRHRHDRHSVRRRGVWLRQPSTARDLPTDTTPTQEIQVISA